MKRRPKTWEGCWRALVLLANLLICLQLMPMSEGLDLFKEEMDELVAPHGNPMIDRDGLMVSFQEGAVAPLDGMTDEELEAELFEHVRRLRPVKGPARPKADLGKFQAYHNALAEIFDPDGEHPARTDFQGHGRKLNYVAAVTAISFGAAQFIADLQAKASTLCHLEGALRTNMLIIYDVHFNNVFWSLYINIIHRAKPQYRTNRKLQTSYRLLSLQLDPSELGGMEMKLMRFRL